jgi:uncharacterized protein (TIGR02145 family)
MNYNTAEGVKGICPIGWHIPANSEFKELAYIVGDITGFYFLTGGNNLKTVGQGTGIGAGTNTSGFSGLLAGYRFIADGSFGHLGNVTYFWSSAEYDASYAFYLGLGDLTDDVFFYKTSKPDGCSVRCVKD